uniref:Uncharacterized protein n=1 Tax=CrAss-like virus sp. ctWDt29 TaxID=2825836 RepID=A0A8S5NWN3_9CAUD|nr:MAG TPA: hypothetical protein [CrAss-like virus sp. ctWDt29]
MRILLFSIILERVQTIYLRLSDGLPSILIGLSRLLNSITISVFVTISLITLIINL